MTAYFRTAIRFGNIALTGLMAAVISGLGFSSSLQANIITLDLTTNNPDPIVLPGGDNTFGFTPFNIDYLIVGGGGGGGGAYNYHQGGGGGAGGFLQGTGLSISGGQAIVVGTGGVGGLSSNGTNGGDSSAFGFTATGGGGGGSYNTVGGNGGSGGGGASNGSKAGGTGVAGQGNDGAAGVGSGTVVGGGGGGASAAGGIGTGSGGAGAISSITGPATPYAVGGDGGDKADGTVEPGAQSDNTGNGGDAASTNQSWHSGRFTGGDGGSGIVVVRYAGPQVLLGGTVSTDGGDTVHSFTDPGASSLGFSANIEGDISGSGNMEWDGGGTLAISGDLSHTGSTTTTLGTLILSGNNSTASGPTILNGGITQFESPDSIPGPGKNLTLNSDATMVFGPSFGSANIQTALNDRLVTSSAGTVAIANNTSTDIDFDTPGLSAAYFGAVGDLTYTGTLTPNGGTYRLGGDGGALALSNALISGNSMDIRGPFTVRLSGNDTTLNALSTTGDGQILENASATPITLTVGSANASSTFSGSIGDGAGGGALTLAKSGSGTLKLYGTNTYSGGTTINAGTLDIVSDSNLGVADSPIIFDGSAKLSNTAGGTIDLGARPITLNNNALATFYIGRGRQFITTGAVTGDGGVALQVTGGNSPKLYLLSTNNTFTGPVEIRSGSDRPYLTVNSLADGPGAITLNNGAGHFVYASGAVAPLVLNNRPIVVAEGGYIDNNSSFPMTINSSITASGTNSPTLYLTGSNGGTIGANIDEGAATLALNVSGNWTFSGTNTYSGMTIINNGATLQVMGAQAMPAASKIQMWRNTTLKVLTDAAGTVNLGNDLQFRRQDTSTGITQNYTVDVGNNGGGTTGSTIVLGDVDYTVGDMRPSRQFNTTGANGYSVEIGDVALATELQGTATGGAQRIRGMTAPLEITGTVKQIDGNSGTRPNSNSLYLGGTGTGNLVSGIIADADDFTAGTNPNAKAQNVYKGESGDWTLSGANTYTGTTTIAGGLLRVDGSLHADSDVAVSNTGSVKGYLGGTGTVGGNVDLTGTGGMDLKDSAVGTLNIGGNLNITGAAGANNFFFDLGNGAGGTDLISVAGNTTMANTGAGVINLNQLSGSKITAGTYDLITAGGTTIPNLSYFTLATTAAFGNTFSLTGTGDNVQVVVTGVSGTGNQTWTGSGASWTDAGNWSSAVPNFDSNVTVTSDNNANFGNLDANFDINSLNYDSTASPSTALAPGALSSAVLTLEAQAVNGNPAGSAITVATPDSGAPVHTISAGVGLADSQTWTVESGAALKVDGVVSDFGAGNSLTKAGDGTLTMTGANTYQGATIIESGILIIDKIANATAPNPLGMSSAAADNLVLNNGTTLKMAYGGDNGYSTDRGFTINGTADGDSATLDVSNTDNKPYLKGVTFSNTASPAYGTPNQTRTLILAGTRSPWGGNYTGASNKVAANIADNGTGAVSVVKNGPGYWWLLGNSSFTGGVTINDGRLILGHDNALGNGSLTFTGSSTLDIYTKNPTVKGLASGAGGGTIMTTNGSRTFTVDQAGDSTFGGAIQNGNGTISFTKTGAGTLTLSGDNTYTGATAVDGGTLAVSGTLSNEGGVTIDNGARFIYNNMLTPISGDVTIANGTIGGTGTIDTPVAIGLNAVQSPGNSPGTQPHTNDLTWGGGGTLLWEINDATGTLGTDPGWDLVTVASPGQFFLTATSGDEFTIRVTSLTLGNVAGDAANFDPSMDYNWMILDTDGDLTGDFSTDSFVMDTGDFTNDFTGVFDLVLGSDIGGDNTELWLSYTGVSIPEPTTLILAGLGLLGMYCRRPRRK